MANKGSQNEESKNISGQSRNKPSSNQSAHSIPKDHANTANHKGAVDLGTDGTKATASQQQGQGSWNAKDHDNRPGSKSGGSGGGQGANNKTGKSDR